MSSLAVPFPFPFPSPFALSLPDLDPEPEPEPDPDAAVGVEHLLEPPDPALLPLLMPDRTDPPESSISSTVVQSRGWRDAMRCGMPANVESTAQTRCRQGMLSTSDRRGGAQSGSREVDKIKEERVGLWRNIAMRLEASRRRQGGKLREE
jgi:hypothetical protein